MSIIFTDPDTAYYLPALDHPDPDPAPKDDCCLDVPKDDDVPPVRNRFELKLKNDEPFATSSKTTLEPFVTTQKIEDHSDKGMVGLSLCVISNLEPPEPEDEQDARYIAALDYAMIEAIDIIIIEPYELARRTNQWINITEFFFNSFGSYLCSSVAATLMAKSSDYLPTFVSVGNMLLFRYYKKYAMGDPIHQYRNLDFLRNEDIDKLYFSSGLLDVRGSFSSVVMKDSGRERKRIKLIHFLMALQLGLCTYKFAFGCFLESIFPDRHVM